MRVQISDLPFQTEPTDDFGARGKWPAHWIAHPEAEVPFVCAFKKEFHSDHAGSVRVHVTADERYVLYLNGKRIGRGSERGDANHWYFETYDLPVESGRNVLVAQVFAMGKQAALAQWSVEPGFLLCPEDREYVDALATGAAEWQTVMMPGYTMVHSPVAWGTGAKVDVNGSEFHWGFETGDGEGWVPAVKRLQAMDFFANDVSPVHRLLPASLPAMLDEERNVGTVRFVADANGLEETCKVPVRLADILTGEQIAWQAFLRNEVPVTVPAHTSRRILIDLDDYYCAYPELVVSGGKGASVRINWQESLWHQDDAGKHWKGNRDEIDGKCFMSIWWRNDGVGDMFRPDGGENRRFSTLWWMCGRYVEVLVRTAEAPLTLRSLKWFEVRYPLQRESVFEADDSRIASTIPVLVRAMQMCSHETYFDCPFYEQLMYIGDTRLEVLTTYVMTQDDRLPRKAIEMFEASSTPEGLTQSRYPSNVLQMIPPFSIWYVAMVHDFALWRGDLNFTAKSMKRARLVLDRYMEFVNSEGLIQAPIGWNFMDWVGEWSGGIPPDGVKGVSGLLNMQLALVLRLAAKTEEWLGEPELALRHTRRANELIARIYERFWHEGRGMFADDLKHTSFSEHMQSLAILEASLEPGRLKRVAEGLLTAKDLHRATIYFSYYLFEAFRELGRIDAFFDRMPYWYDHVPNGLKTTIESPEPTRSDCHAWGAHPYYHFFASVAGIQPTAPGFSAVRIHPQPGPLSWLDARLPTPKGEIRVSVRNGDVQVTKPEGVSGKLVWKGEERDL